MDVSVACPPLWARTLQIFGSPDKALRWLHTSLSELNNETPEEALALASGVDRVDAILDRIEYGVFS